MVAAAPTAAVWLRGPASDLLFGAGLIYLPFFLAFALAGSTVREYAPHALLPIAALLTATPHYGATLLRAYESPSDRRRYAFFSVWVTALVWMLFVAGIYDVGIGSWILTVYFTWSPWHYTGQNYGIGLMFLGRRGVRVGAGTKRLLYASFVLSFVLTFLAVHVEEAAIVYAPLEQDNVAYRFQPLGIPIAPATALVTLCFLGYVTTTIAAFGILARQAGLRALGPALAIAFSQALWFVVPIMARGSHIGESIAPLASANGEYVFIWIAFAHSLQYLWVTSAYAKRTSDYPGGMRYYARTLLAGSAIWGLPIVLFLPPVLGTHAFDAGLYALVAATVNLHHFVLDGAVWKLRDGRIARALLGAKAERGSDEVRTGPRRLGLAFLAFGGAYTLANLVAMLETGWSLPRAVERGDRERVETAARRLHWLGRDSMDTYLQIANLASRAGDLGGARSAVSRSLEITSSSIGFVNLGILDAGEGRLDRAQLAFEKALTVEPGMVEATYRLALLAWRRGDRQQSLRLLDDAAARAPERADIRDALERARRAEASRDGAGSRFAPRRPAPAPRKPSRPSRRAPAGRGGSASSLPSPRQALSGVPDPSWPCSAAPRPA